MAAKPSQDRILICLPGSLDALSCAMAPASAIRRNFPRARIEAFVAKSFVKLLEPSPDFDLVEAEPETDNLKQAPQYVQRIRRGRYDYVFDLRVSEKEAKFLSAVRHFAGRWIGPLGSSKGGDGHLVSAYGHGLAEAGLRLDPDGIVPDMSWILKLRKTTRTLEPAYFGLGEHYVLLIPGVRPSGAPPWEVGNWAEFAKTLIANGVEVCVAGSNADAALANDICRVAEGARSLAGRADLTRIAALSAQAAAVFTPLNSLSYLAAAAGAPSVVLFGRKDPPSLTSAPRGPGGVISLEPSVARLVAQEDAVQAARALGVFEPARTRESA